MKKFSQPFDAYEIGEERPIVVELRSQPRHYLHLIDNPIYYFYAFQYTHGDFFRALFGYENLWDRAYEELLVKQLDNVLAFYDSSREYYFEEIVMKKDLLMIGLPWRRGVKPAVYFANLQRRWVAKGVTGTARINLLDKPNHVDIEFDNGETMTVSYMRYLRWKNTHIDYRSLKNANRTAQPEQSRANETDGKCREASQTASFSGQVSFRAFDDRLLALRKRRKRIVPMRKTQA